METISENETRTLKVCVGEMIHFDSEILVRMQYFQWIMDPGPIGLADGFYIDIEKKRNSKVTSRFLT